MQPPRKPLLWIGAALAALAAVLRCTQRLLERATRYEDWERALT